MSPLEELITQAVAAKAQREAEAEAEAERAAEAQRLARREAFIVALREELPNLAAAVNVEDVTLDGAGNPYLPIFMPTGDEVAIYGDMVAWTMHGYGRTIRELKKDNARIEERLVLAIGGH